jgi:hypothetical protein
MRISPPPPLAACRAAGAPARAPAALPVHARVRVRAAATHAGRAVRWRCSAAPSAAQDVAPSPPVADADRRRALLGDVVAGVSVAFVCIPQARPRVRFEPPAVLRGSLRAFVALYS